MGALVSGTEGCALSVGFGDVDGTEEPDVLVGTDVAGADVAFADVTTAVSGNTVDSIRNGNSTNNPTAARRRSRVVRGCLRTCTGYRAVAT